MPKDDTLEDTVLENISQTHRDISPALEEILHKPIKILDHGFIRVIDYMGNDSSIVQAARVSYGSGTKKVNQDKGLISYLMRHYHNTPFEMCDIKFHIKLPIFIARQWIRHRTASVNEYSARYSILGKDFYMPEKDQMAVQSKTNMQGRGDLLSPEQAEKVSALLREDSERCYKHYEEMLNEDAEGNTVNEDNPKFARELARMNLTMNYYTEWYWKINLHNLLNFIRLRADNHAQYEIRVYAQAMLDIVKRWVPFTYEAFDEHRMNGSNISRKGMEVVKQMIAGKEVTQEESGMTKREWNELMNTLG
ncbi:MAG: FAD-dependent thymidylate synthase [Alphaproteobacteria bacterium]|nr:FAD-dependent thymidylate synthase [Alphaproteobacteria bacterium]